jgi:hypothetical protein
VSDAREPRLKPFVLAERMVGDLDAVRTRALVAGIAADAGALVARAKIAVVPLAGAMLG